MSKSQNTKQQGFTLVELLIVVIILGILAAVVIPQFNSAAAESREAAVASNLATVRQAIEMYKVQHNDTLPGPTVVAFENQLTSATLATGVVDAAGPYGPYLRNSFPANPNNGLSSIALITAAPVANDAVGWLYNATSGEFRASTSGNTASGVTWISL